MPKYNIKKRRTTNSSEQNKNIIFTFEKIKEEIKNNEYIFHL